MDALLGKDGSRAKELGYVVASVLVEASACTVFAMVNDDMGAEEWRTRPWCHGFAPGLAVVSARFLLG